MYTRLEFVARARHDLGKYVAFQTRCLGPQASVGDVRSALDVDLNATRSTPRQGCAAVWQNLRAGFVSTGVDPREIDAIDVAVAALATGASRLDELDGAALHALGQCAIALGDRLRGLHRRLLEESEAS